MSSSQYRYQLRRSHSVLLRTLRAPFVWAPLASLSLAGQEHGRTIPLADVVAVCAIMDRSVPVSTCYNDLLILGAPGLSS